MSHKLVPLGSVVDYIRGITFKPTDVVEPTVENAVVCMRTKNIQKDLDESDLIAVDQAFVKRDEQYLREGDLLISSANSWELVGKTVYVPDLPYAATAGGFISIIRARTRKIDARYLFHWIMSGRTQDLIRNCGRKTTNISNLSSKLFLELEIPLPPLEEQKRIAAILDKADSLRRKRAQAIALADDFLRATFLDMFGDPVTNPKGLIKVRLDSICDVGSSKRVFVEELKENGVPFYRGTEIGQLGDRRKVEPTLFVAEEHYARLKSEAGVPQKGDLLLPSICPDGRIYVVDTEEKFYFKDARVLWIKVDHSNIDSFYLQWFLKSIFASEYSKIASGTTFAELKIFALKQLEVCLPPIDVQRHFAKVVNSTERLLKSYEKSREIHDQLSQSFQHGSLG